MGGSNWDVVDESLLPPNSSGVFDDDGSSIVRLDTGELRQTCLNPRLASSHQRQLDGSVLFAIITTSVFVLSILLGALFLWYLQRDFRIVEDQMIRLQGKARLAMLAAQQQRSARDNPVPHDFTEAALAECRELEQQNEDARSKSRNRRVTNFISKRATRARKLTASPVGKRTTRWTPS